MQSLYGSCKISTKIVLREIRDILLIMFYKQPKEFFGLRLLILQLRLIFMVKVERCVMGLQSRIAIMYSVMIEGVFSSLL